MLVIFFSQSVVHNFMCARKIQWFNRWRGKNRRTFSISEVGLFWKVGFISLCALSLREVPVNIITEERRWIVVAERLENWDEGALRVVGCAFISARSRWKTVVNISPTSPWIDAVPHCSAPCRRKLKHVSAATVRDARGLPLSRSNTRREIRGIYPRHKSTEYKRTDAPLALRAKRPVESFRPNKFFRSHLRYVTSVNLINCCEMAEFRDPVLYIYRMRLSRLADFFRDNTQHAK